MKLLIFDSIPAVTASKYQAPYAAVPDNSGLFVTSCKQWAMHAVKK
jgi:hypothetical protein